MQRPLEGKLVVDFTRYLPGAFAGAELLRLGARVVRVERAGGDPMRATSPEWHDALNCGKESVAWDDGLAAGVLARADIVLESFRPGVAAELGIGPDDAPPSAVYCSITGFGTDGPHAQRAGHDLNYAGWAGVLEATAPALPPVQVADLAAGALVAVTEILAALIAGGGARIVVSMTHGAHRLASRASVLTSGHACYRMYETADGRHLTVAALEPKFFARLCELLGHPELAERQYDPDQESLTSELAASFRRRSLDEWLDVFEREDVCVGPVATYAEAQRAFGTTPPGIAAALGEHTADWRRELGL
ncbi:MAG TPA: CaiB/BaiF CoA-transferase family protein [Gaiellaceae bacterium]|nr:CaiB/BaiF CoA-transferase family protein [Gaiellaceae bacterium]